MEATPEHPPSPAALRQGYEPSVVNARGLLVFVFFFLLTAVVLHTSIWVYEEYLVDRPRDADAVKSAVAPARPFAEPDVQPSESHNRAPWEDMADLRRAEAARFEQLGWKADPGTGSAVIPDSIVAQLAERYRNNGPATAPSAAPSAAPSSAPAETPAPTTGTTPSPGGQP